MHITSKGQVTIPVEIREEMGLLPNTEVEFHVEKHRIYLKKIDTKSKRNKSIIKTMRGKGNVMMSTNEILKLTRGK